MRTQGLVLSCLVVATLINLNQAGLVKKVLQHQSNIVSVQRIDNATHPSPGTPVVFSHVYNINVPEGSLCSEDPTAGSDLEPKDAPSGSEVSDHTLDGQNQIVFTHRINIPKQACGCTNSFPELKELLNRLEMLEGEVSTLREKCSGDSTCCSASATGGVGTKPFCSGRGNFSMDICACVCEKGWKGPNCTLPDCPLDCSDQGRCVNGRCECFEGFAGEDCTIEVCAVDCGENGQCIGGACVCAEGFFGDDCSKTACLNDCHGRGHCVDGECVCDEPWTGIDCSELICPKDCYDRGRCVNGTCYCDEGFRGEDCGERVCPNDCMGQGFCVDGRCVCNAGYTGEDCSTLTCPNNCNGRGRCYNGVCICDSGYQGEDCSVRSCPNNCYNRGRCINGRCECDAGFGGNDCSELTCPNNCNGQGHCVNGQCVCFEGFEGEDCSVKTCPFRCYGRGHCVDGKCLCFAGFRGEDCSELGCPNNCQNRGQCVGGQCVCDEGFTGEDCSQKKCPNDCLGHGHCMDGHCICQEGYAGEDCSVQSCPANCNNHGRCINGVCLCDEGFEGPDCREKRCPSDCHGMGQCVDGRCVCDEGYIGEDCSEVSPPTSLIVTEVNPTTVNLTWTNEMVVKEYLVTYVPTGPGGLEMDIRTPAHQTTATLTELEPGIEYSINVFAILNNDRSIPVNVRMRTSLPQPKGLKFKSVKETSVEVFWDQLDIPFDAWELTFHKTLQKDEDGKIVNILPSSQTHFEQPGLGPGQKYNVSVRIVKNNTRGLPLKRAVVTKIDAPGEVEVRDIADRSVLISWSKPVAEVDRIRISYGPSGDPPARHVDVPTENLQHTLEELEPDTDYRVSVSSRRGNKTSDVVHKSFTTAKHTDDHTYGTVHSIPRNKYSVQCLYMEGLDPPREVWTVGQTDDTITVEWLNSRAPVDGYRIKYGPVVGGSHGEELIPRRPGNTTWSMITGLKPGTEYGIGVTAVKKEKESPQATTNAVTDLDAPKDLEARESTETTMTLVWKRPRAKISNYRLAFVSTDGKQKEVEVPASATSYTRKNLVPGMQYTITLVAERGQRKSAPATLTASTALKSTSPGVVALSIASAPTELPVGVYTTGPTTSPVTVRSEITTAGDKPESLSPEPNRDVKVPDAIQTSSKVASANVSNVLEGDSGNQTDALTPGPLSNFTFTGLLEGNVSRPVNTTNVTTEETKPRIRNVTVSDVFWDGFNVSWSSEEGTAFESFVIEVANSEGSERQNLSVSGDALSLGVFGLSPNTSFTIALYGVHQGSILGPIYTDATTASAPMVGKLYVSNVTSESFSLSWNDTEGNFEGFVLEVIDSSWRREPAEYNLSFNAVSYDVTGLRPSTDYIAYLSGVAKGRRAHTISAFATTAAEPDLSGLVVSNVTSDRLSLSWRMGEKMYDNFIVEVRESALPSQAMGRILPIGARSTVLSGLKGDTQYHIKLYASSGNRNSDPLTAVVKTEPKPRLGPVVVSDTHPNNFTLSWNKLAGHFDGFVIRVVDQEQFYDVVELRPPGAAQNVTVPGLVDSTVYNVQFYGISHGRQTPTVSLNTTTAPLPKVENLTISDITPFGFRVSWTARSSEGFSHFQVKVSDSGKLLEPQEFQVPGNQTSLEIWGLITGIGYEISLTGVSGSGLRSLPVTTVAVTEAEPEIEHLFVSDITPESFRLSWTADDIFDRFVIKVRDSKKLAFPHEVNVRGDERTKVLTGLAGGTEYETELYGVTLERRSQPITTVARTGLRAPRAIHFSEVSDTSAIVHWSVPHDLIDSYRITYVPIQGGGPARMIEVDGSLSQTPLTNLIPGESYQVTVIAMKGLEESDPVSSTVTAAVDMPRSLSASNVTDTEALLLWQPAVATVDGYVITYSADRVPPVTEQVSGNTVEFEMNNLEPATHYTATVHAIKDSHRSTPATVQFTTAVDPPRDLTASNIQTDSAVLTWKPPRAPIRGYVLTYKTSDGSIRKEILHPSVTSHRLPKLSGSTDYSVKLQAFAGSESSQHQSQKVGTDFTTVGVLYKNPKDCSQTLLNGEVTSGRYTIYPGGDENLPVQVYCDMSTDGGGWVVFMRRQNGKVDFYRNWKNYTSGFGDVNDEFWLGLNNLHKITSSGQYELRVDLRDGPESAYAQYDRFVVGEPRSRYKVQIGAYSGSAGDSMTYHHNRPFSTYDNDNDIAVTNCALSYKGAYWYKNCHRVNLMGRYGDNSHSK
ncbi:hypothetical protein NFI96_021822, partial [Prochilodus magdalenae]